ncbi:MAG TPA: rRNA maturation RNase YbeY [Candidatus Binatia bacterium]|nr:rRNA maturation RNase YbeY [Candidatus Binatia bacterium]
MRVTLHRSASLDARALSAVRQAALGPLLRDSGDALAVPSRSGLAVRLAGDGELRSLNARHAGIDAATDVLSFPGEGDWVGDIAISVERAIAQRPEDPAAELRLLAVHGLLHCLGFDHGDPVEAARMTGETRRLLPGAAIPDLEAETPTP